MIQRVSGSSYYLSTGIGIRGDTVGAKAKMLTRLMLSLKSWIRGKVSSIGAGSCLGRRHHVVSVRKYVIETNLKNR